MKALLCLIIGFAIGYIYAHNVVSKECEMLGKFYVGKKIYHCVRVEENG